MSFERITRRTRLNVTGQPTVVSFGQYPSLVLVTVSSMLILGTIGRERLHPLLTDDFHTIQVVCNVYGCMRLAAIFCEKKDLYKHPINVKVMSE